MTELNQLFIESEQIRVEADCLFNKNEVEEAISLLAVAISEELAGRNPIVIGIMNGALIPMGILVQELNFPLQIDYLHATRYRENTTGGEMHWKAEPNIQMQDRTVLLVDDIHDEGITLEAIKSFCHKEGAGKIYTAVLVNKVHDRKNDTSADFVALEVPDRYVFGYGMDYKGMLRNAPGIYAVKEL